MYRNTLKLFSIGVQVVATILILSLWCSQAQTTANDNKLSALAKGIKIIEQPKIFLDAAGPKGSTTLGLQNISGEDISRARVTIGSFKRYIDGSPVADVGGTVLLSGPPDQLSKKFYDITDFNKGNSLYIKVEVDALVEAGKCVAPILLNEIPIGELMVWRLYPNFNVDIISGLSRTDGLSGAAAMGSLVSIPEITFERGKEAKIVLKNSDSMTYPISWQFFVGQEVSETDLLTLPPNSTEMIGYSTPDTWFGNSVSGFFKDQEVAGSLRLIYKPAPMSEYPTPRLKDISFKAYLRRHSVAMQTGASAIATLIILALGMVCSIAVSNWIPNLLRRSRINEELDRLDSAVQHLSDRIDSFLKVPIRVERHRLFDDLRAQYAFSPDFPKDAQKCEDNLKILNDRKDILESLDYIYCCIDKTHRVPPTVRDRVEAILQQASELLRRTDLYDPHFPQVKASFEELIRGANTTLDLISKGDPEFAKELASRVSKMAALCDELKNGEAYKLLIKELPTIMEVLNNYEDASLIEKGDYYKIDLDLCRLDLGLKYMQHYDYHKSDPKFEKDWEKQFLMNLKMGDPEGLRMAALAFEELHGEVSIRDVLAQIRANPPAVSIRREAVEVHVNQSIELRVEFDSEALNQSAARNEFVCIWDFDHGGFKETGWRLSHYFPEERVYEVRVTFADRRTMKHLQNDNKEDITISETIQVAPPANTQIRERAWVEWAALALALLGAALTLLGGVKDHLSKLELSAAVIAIFLGGFATNQIKDLITKRQT